jgi:hypothetical protein
MEQDHSNTSALDLFIVWVGTVASHITASDMMVWATLTFTLIKTYVLIRDEFFKKE